MDKLEPLAVSAPEAARLLGVSKPTISLVPPDNDSILHLLSEYKMGYCTTY